MISSWLAFNEIATYVSQLGPANEAAAENRGTSCFCVVFSLDTNTFQSVESSLLLTYIILVSKTALIMSPAEGRIPWKCLASQFEPAFVRLNATEIASTPSAIVTKKDMNSEADLTVFVIAVMEVMTEDIKKMQIAAAGSAIAASAITASDVYIDDDATKLISPTIERMRAPVLKAGSSSSHHVASSPEEAASANAHSLCTHNKEAACACPIPLWTRQVSWLSEADDTFMTRGFKWYLDEHNYGLDYFQAMLLHEDELLPSLERSRPLVAENSLRGQSVYRSYTYFDLHSSLRIVYESTLKRALMPILAFNILRELPETWDADAKRQPWHDYRDTSLYQTTIATSCAATTRGHGDMSSFPHNSFFDVPDFRWKLMPWVQREASLIPDKLLPRGLEFGKEKMVGRGKLPFDSFIASRKGLRRRLRRGERDVDEAEARTSLGGKGLPTEVVDAIIDMADEEGQPWKLVVRDDPLHPANRRVLDSYLEYCWKLVARCWLGLDALDGHDYAVRYMQNLLREAVEVLGSVDEHCKQKTWCGWCTIVS